MSKYKDLGNYLKDKFMGDVYILPPLRRYARFFDRNAIKLEKSRRHKKGDKETVFSDFVLRVLSGLSYLERRNGCNAAYSFRRAGNAAVKLDMLEYARLLYTVEGLLFHRVGRNSNFFWAMRRSLEAGSSAGSKGSNLDLDERLEQIFDEFRC